MEQEIETIKKAFELIKLELEVARNENERLKNELKFSYERIKNVLKGNEELNKNAEYWAGEYNKAIKENDLLKAKNEKDAEIYQFEIDELKEIIKSKPKKEKKKVYFISCIKVELGIAIVVAKIVVLAHSELLALKKAALKYPNCDFRTEEVIRQI